LKRKDGHWSKREGGILRGPKKAGRKKGMGRGKKAVGEEKKGRKKKKKRRGAKRGERSGLK